MVQKFYSIMRNFARRLGRERQNLPPEDYENLQQYAEDFVRLVELTRPYKETVGGAMIFGLNLNPETKRPEYQDRIRRKGAQVLGRAKITHHFQRYIIEDLLASYQLGVPVDSDYIVATYGIDPQRGQWGIFGSDAGKIERSFMDDEMNLMLARSKGIDTDAWERAFEELHSKNRIT